MRSLTVRQIVVVAWVLLVVTLAGCATSPPAQTEFMEQMGAINYTKREMETVMYRYGYHYAKQVELAATKIFVQAPDQETKNRAITWVTLGVPEMMRASFNHEPLVGMAQSWTYASLVREYFTTGYGKDHFGAYQDIAVTASTQLEADIVWLARDMLPEAAFDTMRTRVEAWTAQHPITNDRYVTAGFAEQLLKAMGAGVAGGLSATGAMNEQMVAMADRTNLMMAFMPRQVQWQTAEALAMSRSMIEDMADSTLVRVQTETDAGLDKIFAFLSQERELTVEALNTARAEVLRAIADERTAVLTYLVEERGVVFKEISRERDEVMKEINALTLATLEEGIKRAEATADRSIDRLYIHTIYLLAAPFVLMIIAAIVVGLWVRNTTNRIMALHEGKSQERSEPL